MSVSYWGEEAQVCGDLSLILLLPKFLAGSDTRSSVEELALITSRVCGQLREGFKKKKHNKKQKHFVLRKSLGWCLLVYESLKIVKLCACCESQLHLAFPQLLLGV